MTFNKKILPIVLSTSAAVIIAGGMNHIESVAKTAGTSDITNSVLTSTNPDCGSHAGDYSSSITDVSRNKAFESMISITASETNCTISTNQIPNHDAGEVSNFATTIKENSASLDIPRSPKLSSEKTELGMGASSILLNGVKWEAYPAA